MSTIKPRTYSKSNRLAVTMLGRLIKLSRKELRWSEKELAERAVISRLTLKRIEKGDLKCEIGLAFEVAVLVDIQLFQVDRTDLARNIERLDEVLAVLPKRIDKRKVVVDDDF